VLEAGAGNGADSWNEVFPPSPISAVFVRTTDRGSMRSALIFSFTHRQRSLKGFAV
jgi:hypothetical protein